MHVSHALGGIWPLPEFAFNQHVVSFGRNVLDNNLIEYNLRRNRNFYTRIAHLPTESGGRALLMGRDKPEFSILLNVEGNENWRPSFVSSPTSRCTFLHSVDSIRCVCLCVTRAIPLQHSFAQLELVDLSTSGAQRRDTYELYSALMRCNSFFSLRFCSTSSSSSICSSRKANASTDDNDDDK